MHVRLLNKGTYASPPHFTKLKAILEYPEMSQLHTFVMSDHAEVT